MVLSSDLPAGPPARENMWVSTRPAVTLDQKNWAPPEPPNCDDKPGCSPWNPQGPLVNSDAFDGGPALSWDGTELYFFRVNPVNANNNIGLVCTEGFVPEPPETPDTGPVCRDLYVSKRSYITNTVLSSSANPSVFGQPVPLTPPVAPPAVRPPPAPVPSSEAAT